MPLFRPHTGSLDYSLTKIIFIKNEDELRNIIYEDWKIWEGAIKKNDGDIFDKNNFNIIIESYIFDTRTKWDTYIVKADLIEKDKFLVVGYLNEPFD